jgi:hypothetical protein
MISPFKPCRRPGFVLLSIGLLHGCCLASPDATNEFRFYTRPLVIPERGPVTSYVLQTSKARFSFLPPLNWAVKENATTKEVVMMARNLITSIRFKIVEAAPETTKEARVAQWRQTAQENHPDGKITAEFPCYTSKVEGTALDLERIAPNKTKVFTRLAFIPLPDGRVEFDLTTTGGDLANTRLAFGNFLTSFRVEPPATK